MIREVLFDVDGVIVKSREKYFSQRLAEKQGLTLEEVMPFFKGDYQLCTIGKADLKEVLPKYLASWKWTDSIESLLEFWFSEERELDAKVIQVVDRLRSRGIKVGLVTDNEEYRGRYLLDEVGLGQKFDDIFISCRMGVKKSNPEFFNKVIQTTGLKPEEIQFWDDDQKNVDVAKLVGIDGRLFTNSTDIRENLL